MSFVSYAVHEPRTMLTQAGQRFAYMNRTQPGGGCAQAFACGQDCAGYPSVPFLGPVQNPYTQNIQSQRMFAAAPVRGSCPPILGDVCQGQGNRPKMVQAIPGNNVYFQYNSPLPSLPQNSGLRMYTDKYLLPKQYVANNLVQAVGPPTNLVLQEYPNFVMATNSWTW